MSFSRSSGVIFLAHRALYSSSLFARDMTDDYGATALTVGK